MVGGKAKSWEQAQEHEEQEDDVDGWGQKFEQSLQSLLMETTPGKGKGKGKLTGGKGESTLGKGKGNGKGKGKGRGKGKGNPDMQALEDLPKEEQMEEGLKKLKKTKDLVTQTMSNYEEALEKVSHMGYLTKTAFKEKEGYLKALEATLDKVKKLLGKGDKNKLEVVKEALKEAVASLAEAKEEAKELVQISMKANSKQSKASKKS